MRVEGADKQQRTTAGIRPGVAANRTKWYMAYPVSHTTTGGPLCVLFFNVQVVETFILKDHGVAGVDASPLC